MEIARGQAATGHDVAILSAAKPGALPEKIGNVRILTIEPSSGRWAHWRCVFSRRLERGVVEKINSVRPDVVHAHTISRQIGYRWMTHSKLKAQSSKLKPQTSKLIITCHDVSHVAYGKVTGSEKHLWMTEMQRYKWGWNPLRNVLIRRFLQSADVILTVSDALRDYLMKRGLSNLRTLHNGIDLDFWKPGTSREEARRKLNLPLDRFLFLLAGRMGVDKGSTLIAATLPQEADLILAGDRFSDEFTPVKDRMHVFYNQSADEMKLQYAAADVVLIPSRCLDCFPTVALEAMAMERPVMATSWGGAKEAIDDGVTGWILDPLNEQTWREKMEWCVLHQSELAMTGKRGQEKMNREFSLETMTKKLQKIYE